MRKANCRNWSMVRKLKMMENDKHTVGPGYGEKTEKRGKGDTDTLQDLEYGEKQ